VSFEQGYMRTMKTAGLHKQASPVRALKSVSYGELDKPVADAVRNPAAATRRAVRNPDFQWWNPDHNPLLDELEYVPSRTALRKTGSVVGELGKVLMSPIRLMKSQKNVRQASGALDDSRKVYNEALSEASRMHPDAAAPTAGSVAEDAARAFKADPGMDPLDTYDPSRLIDTFGNTPEGRRQAQRAVEVGRDASVLTAARQGRNADAMRLGGLGLAGGGGYYAYQRGKQDQQPQYRRFTR